MAQPPKKTPDRHYDFRGLNVVFAWSSLALLVVTVWMVFADYAKPWKRLQAEFRERERQMAAAEAEAERQKIDVEQRRLLVADIEHEEESLAAQRQELRELESREVALGKQVYAADADVRKTKSLLDTAKYQLDVAKRDGREGRIARARERVDTLESQWLEDQILFQSLDTEQRGVADAIVIKRQGLTEAEGKLEALESALTNLEAQVANLDKKLDYFVLNAPVMDFIQPDLKIEQVMLSGLYQDINFTDVERVDRCMTCHVAANRQGFEEPEWEQPFTSHPRLDLFLTASSPHPYTRFGCTACHQGLDRATDFARAGHSPRNPAQRAEWEEKYGWKPQKYLDTPILPGGYTEAGCLECHADNVWVAESELVDTGRELATRMGCFGCHAINYPAYQDLPRPGPSLYKVAAKTNEAWAYRWIESPRDFHPTTWMPHFFFLENIQGELNHERQKAEINAIVAYLWDTSETPAYPDPPPGDPARGQALFQNVGCEGCHVLDAEAERDQFYPQFNRMHGPNLIRTGSKVSAGWLYAWLKDPKEYNPLSRMPSLRLTDREAADLAAYLMQSRDPEFENLELPEVDGAVRDELVLYYLQNTETIEQSEATLAAMSGRERDVYLGNQTIRKYGCFGCHEMAGFDDAKPIGVELTEEGSKPVHQFDFGHVHHVEYRAERMNGTLAHAALGESGEGGEDHGDAAHAADGHGDTVHREVQHTRHDWIKTKMLRPRVWDQGKEEIKTYAELYRMPDFGMSEREADAIVSNVLGFTKESVLQHRKAGQGDEGPLIGEGRKLITDYNCQGCHLIEGLGHAIDTAIEDVGMLPPNLAAQGARVRSDWLFDYLHDPGSETMRPWLSVRMPSFGFDDGEVNALLSYFSASDGRTSFLSEPERPSNRSLTVGRVTFNMLQCAKCHPSGPQDTGGAVSAGELAPSLLLADDRLRHDWVPDWIVDPQSWVPGTKMPANFPRQGGSYQSPMPMAIDAPMFSSEKRQMMRHFDSEEELKAFLGDADKVAVALRDHIWWNLAR